MQTFILQIDLERSRKLFKCVVQLRNSCKLVTGSFMTKAQSGTCGAKADQCVVRSTRRATVALIAGSDKKSCQTAS